jgi:glycosyltransferase involved in cell wall biosynthesis
MGVPTISVIVPAFNADRTILETLNSIQRQTMRDIEIIVVDDGSTDDTVATLETVSDERLKVVSYSNGGLSVARNRGFELASAPFISFLDADDLWTPDKLEKQLARLKRQPDAGVAYSWTIFIDNDGRYLFAKEPLYFEGDVHVDLLSDCFIASGSNVLLRRACFEDVGGFDPDLRYTEDWDFFLRVAKTWPFVVIRDYQILYRFTDQALSSRVEEIERCNHVVVDRAYASAPEALRPLRNKTLAQVDRYIAQLYLFRRPGTAWRGEAGKRLWRAIRLDRRLLLSLKTQGLLWVCLGVYLVPRGLSARVIRSLMRLYGVWMRVTIPQLRERVPRTR